MPDAGLIGSALTGAANAYFEALHGPSLAEERAAREEKQRKAVEDRLRVESQRKVDEAQALYYSRRQPTNQRLYNVRGNLVEYDPETNTSRTVYEGPTTEAKLKDQREATIHAAMVRRMGGRPMEAWTPEEISGPVLRPYWELLGQGRSPYAVIADKGDVILKDQYSPKEPAPPSPPGGASPERVQQPPPEKVPTPPPVPAKKLPTTGQHAPPRGGAKPSSDLTVVTPDPTFLKHYEGRLPHLPVEQADEQWTLLTDPRATTKPANLAAFLAAYKKTYGKLPPGVEPTGMTTGEQPGPAVTPPATTTTKASPGTSPARPRNVPLTEEAQAEEARKREDQQLQRDHAARSQTQLDVTLRNEKFEHEKNAQRLKEYEEAKQAKNLAAQERIEKNILLETRDYKAQIVGANETIALLKEMAKYVTPETVGARGAVRQVWQNLMGQFERSASAPLTGEAGELQRKVMPMAGKLVQQAKAWQALENTQAREEGRIPTKIYIPDYSKYGYDPRMTFIAFLKEVIGYAQARAMNGIGRLTDQDLDRAKFALGIDDWTKSAAHVQTSLLYVSKELEDKKVRVQAEIDAITRQLKQHAPKAGASGAETGEPAKE